MTQRLFDGSRDWSIGHCFRGIAIALQVHGVLSLAEQTLAETELGTATLRAFHQQLFQVCSDPLKRDIERITGLKVCEADNHKTTAAVQVLSNGTVVQVFVLAGDLPAESWSGT